MKIYKCDICEGEADSEEALKDYYVEFSGDKKDLCADCMTLIEDIDKLITNQVNKLIAKAVNNQLLKLKVNKIK